MLGHFDLVKRYGVAHYGRLEPEIFAEEIRAVLRAAVEAGVGLEINASGLRQAPGEPYPGLTVLRWYRELGGEIVTVGSDAHRVEHLAAGMDQALALAQAAGFTDHYHVRGAGAAVDHARQSRITGDFSAT